MDKMRFFIGLILLTGVIRQADAQRVKFNDLFPRLEAMSQEEQKTTIKEYLSVDKEHPNANFRLALIYENIFKNTDPLTQYELVLASAEQAKLRFLKAKLLIDEREVSKNTEYYFPIFRTVDAKGKPKVEFSRVMAKMLGGYDSALLFLTRIPPIYSSFTRSVNFYDRAVKIFADINKQYLTLDDLYLYYNDEMDFRMTALKTNFDSARFYFDRYQELTKEFPIAEHNQKYEVKPIVTYRLNGLITRMNFLTSTVELWDYSSWVEDVRKNMNTEILSLRTRLSQNEEKLDEALRRMSEPGGETVVPVKTDKQLVYNLNNYDKQSLVLALVEYKTFKQGWLINSKKLVVDTASAEHTAENFSTLIYENRDADTLLVNVKSRMQPDKVKKHDIFVNQYYGGTEGLLKYYGQEKKQVDDEFVRYTEELRGALLEIGARDTVREKEKQIRFNNKWNIAMAPRLPAQELLDKGEPITLRHLKNRDGSVYLSGIYKPDKKLNNIVAFVARVNPDGKPGWMQNFNLKMDSASVGPDANNFPGAMELTQEGCALVMRSFHLTRQDVANTMVYFNEKGEEKFRIRLRETAVARSINFIEHSNSFVVVMKGQEETETVSAPENVHLLSVNAIGDVLWQREIPLTGTFTSLVNLLDGFMLVGNYSVVQDAKGQTVKARPGEASPFMIRLNERGEVILVNTISPSRSVCVVRVIKVGDNSINLLGFEDTFQSAKGKSILSKGRILHMMINRFGQIVCSNL